ncbi:hypothetical protein QBC44DRAFT_327061 [Cladorrhinum sp. PSN332]|nr:hypothetical protein QBC44DRAFT_327061 [Cladorrhinum sp. PSN332]
MATLIGDVFTDSPSRFHNHNMIRTSTLQHQHSHHFHQNPPIARSHEQDVVESQSHTPRPTANTSRQGSAPLAGRKGWEDSPVPTSAEKREKQTLPRSSNAINGGGGGAARLPSPPSSSSSSSETPSGAIPADDGAHDPVSSSSASSTSTATTLVPPPTKAIPSPASDSEPRWASSDTHPTMDLPTSASLNSLGDAPSSPIPEQKTIHVRDLAHIQTLAKTDILTPEGSNGLNDPPLQQMKYEISAMPINDIIEMVAALLTKITTTNDLQHDALNRNAHHLRQAQAQAQAAAAHPQEGKDGSGSSNMSPLSSSVLAFHGKNVPSISILSYLSRIHKYCPTTYEVFLSLLVYFDRMTERVNDMVVKSEEARRVQQQSAAAQQNAPAVDPGPPGKKSADEDTIMNDYDDDEDDDTQSDETDEELADTDDEKVGVEGRRKGEKGKKTTTKGEEEMVVEGAGGGSGGGAGQATYFVVDSYNIHRLIIAGVTCSSKFFSDVFYTNSRYAKVFFSSIASWFYAVS